MAGGALPAAAKPASGAPAAAPAAAATGDDIGAQLEKALAELHAANQTLVSHGVPAKDATAHEDTLRAREPAASKAGGKAQQALLTDVESVRDLVRKEDALLADIDTILADADAQAA